MTAIWWFLYGQFLVVLFIATIVIGLLAKTHAKTAQSASRLNNLAPVAKTANQANATATTAQAGVTTLTSAGVISNASFLGGLSPVGGVSFWPTFGGSPTLAELTADVQNGVTVFNELLTSMASNGFT